MFGIEIRDCCSHMKPFHQKDANANEMTVQGMPHDLWTRSSFILNKRVQISEDLTKLTEFIAEWHKLFVHSQTPDQS
jgi:hypothetical protein